MLGVLLSILTIPRPSPSPLKTITIVHVSSLCTALRGSIGHAVEDLIKNNVAVDNAKSLFLKMARDEVSSADRNMVMDLDVQRIGPLMDGISANIRSAESDLRGIDLRSQSSSDQQRLLQMKKGLETVIAHQNEELNVLSGVYFSYNGNRLMGRADGLPKADGGTGRPVDDPSAEPPIPTAGYSNATPEPQTSAAPRGAVREVDVGLAAHTKFAGIFNELTRYQIGEQALEAAVGRAILESADKCRGH